MYTSQVLQGLLDWPEATCQGNGTLSGCWWKQIWWLLVTKTTTEPLTSSVDFWGTCREKDVMVTTVIVFPIWPAADLQHLEAYI